MSAAGCKARGQIRGGLAAAGGPGKGLVPRILLATCRQRGMGVSSCLLKRQFCVTVHSNTSIASRSKAMAKKAMNLQASCKPMSIM